MYVPDVFALNDPALVESVIRDYAFGLLVTADGGPPEASHLPFLFDPDKGANGTLSGHMARANRQWKAFANGNEALVVFQGAHSYISPAWYNPGPAVPTWNYLAVHCYGVPRVTEDPDEVRGLLARLVERHESEAGTGWSMASQEDSFIDHMQRGIVAFEIPVSRVEAKAKLSQNKASEERNGVVAGLESQANSDARALAAAMTKS
ncbi:MAG: FMN-binding negative transcriptional regulator [Pseudomonadota bacterium]